MFKTIKRFLAAAALAVVFVAPSLAAVTFGKLDAAIIVAQSIDLRGKVGGGTDDINVAFVYKPIWLMGGEGWLNYYWDPVSTATDDAPSVDSPGTWASVVQPTGLGTGRWILTADARSSIIPLNPDWNATVGPTKILGKPTIPATPVNADWSAVSGLAQILNKPAIPAAFSIGAPAALTVTLGASAYQANNSAKDAVVVLNVGATSTQTLLSTTEASQKIEVVVGATSGAVTGATPTGAKVGQFESTQSNTVVVGLTLNQKNAGTITFLLPAGYYFRVRQTAGSQGFLTSAFDQAIN